MDNEELIKEKIDQLMTATGALAEMLFAFYGQLLKAGFASSDALSLTASMMNRMLGLGGEK